MAVVIVVVLVILGALFALGVFNPARSSSPGVVGVPSYYSQNIASAESVASSAPGGPWTLVAALGINVSSSVSGPDDSAFGEGGSCTYNPAPGAPSSIVLAATPAGSTLGTAASWVFIATSPAGELMYILEAQGQTTPIAIGTGSCVTDIHEFGAIASLSPVNSSLPGTEGFAAGAGAFLSSHPGASVVYVLLGPATGAAGGGVWALELDTCGFTSSSGSGTVWVDEWNATSGSALTGSGTTESVSC